MIQGTLKFFVAAIACTFASQAFAQTNCIKLETVAQVEKEAVSDKGEKTKVLVEAGKVVPGMEVVWTVTAARLTKNIITTKTPKISGVSRRARTRVTMNCTACRLPRSTALHRVARAAIVRLMCGRPFVGQTR